MDHLIAVSPNSLITDEDLDRQIAQAERNGDVNALTALLPIRLERLSMGEEYFLILQARDLYLIKKHGAWDRDTYPTFAHWVDSDYSRRPYGKSLSTVYNMIAIWSFYAVEQGWTIEEMVRAGKGKLEAAKGLAAATRLPDGRMDPVVREVLLDEDVPAHGTLAAYEARRSLDENEPMTPMFSDSPPPELPLYTFYATDGMRPAGTLEVLLPEHGGSQRVARVLGVLSAIHDEELVPYIFTLLKRAKVRII